jgi:hypothetical protein
MSEGRETSGVVFIPTRAIWHDRLPCSGWKPSRLPYFPHAAPWRASSLFACTNNRQRSAAETRRDVLVLPFPGRYSTTPFLSVANRCHLGVAARLAHTFSRCVRHLTGPRDQQRTCNLPTVSGLIAGQILGQNVGAMSPALALMFSKIRALSLASATMQHRFRYSVHHSDRVFARALSRPLALWEASGPRLPGATQALLKPQSSPSNRFDPDNLEIQGGHPPFSGSADNRRPQSLHGAALEKSFWVAIGIPIARGTMRQDSAVALHRVALMSAAWWHQACGLPSGLWRAP